MSFTMLRPAIVSRTGLNSMLLAQRGIATSRVAAVQASKIRRDAPAASADPNATAGFKYVPGGPILPGTVNDPATFPASDKAHGSYHWVFERGLSAALIPIMAGAAVSSGSAYPIMDGVLAVSLIIHSHLGFDQCITDYFHPRKAPFLGPLMVWMLRVATALSVYGVYEFNTNDIGLTELVRRMWKA